MPPAAPLGLLAISCHLQSLSTSSSPSTLLLPPSSQTSTASHSVAVTGAALFDGDLTLAGNLLLNVATHDIKEEENFLENSPP